jgi:hypothetical protein
MAGFDFSWLGPLTKWLDPEERKKQKRIKRDELEEERTNIMKQKVTVINIHRIMEIDEALKKINRDLGN